MTILPLIMPQPGEILNLLQLVKWREHGEPDAPGYSVTCTFAGGVKREFTGDAARIVRSEMVFAFNLYRKFIDGINIAEQQNSSNIIAPPANFNGRVN